MWYQRSRTPAVFARRPGSLVGWERCMNRRTRCSRRCSRAVFVAARAAGLLPVVLAAADASAQMVYEPFDYGSTAVGTPLANLTGTSPTFTGYTNPSNSVAWYDAN